MEKMLLNGLIWVITYYISLKTIVRVMYNPKKIKYFVVKKLNSYANEIIECENIDEVRAETEFAKFDYIIKGEVIK